MVPAGINRAFHGIGLGIPDNWPLLYGSSIISRRLKSLGYSGLFLRNRIIAGNAHDVDNPALMDTMTANWASAVICSPATNHVKIQKSHPYQLQIREEKTFLVTAESGEWEIYDMSGRILNRWHSAKGQHTEISRKPCLIRYRTNSAEGSFLCSP